MRLMVTVMCVLLTCCSGNASGEEAERSIVGAIRWDAWHGTAGMDSGHEVFGNKEVGRITPGMAVERSLGPKHWHYRLPFFAKVISENKVEARANSPEVMDQEIAYASQAGLDYWAFLTYGPKSPMTIGLDLYLSSKSKSKIRFCMILHHIREMPEEVERLVGYMKDPQYVRVLGDRPLLYAFQCRAKKKFYDDLLAAAAEAGLKRPYVVNMGNCSKQATFDAASSYAGIGGKRTWDSQKRKQKVVPAVSAGWDRRPRVESPVPWEGGGKGKPVKGGRRRSAEKAATDIAGGVKSALEWNRGNPDAGEANAVIIYAWNEFDEGGWICPTLSEGTSRLDAISKVLKEAEKTTQPKDPAVRLLDNTGMRPIDGNAISITS